MKKKIKLVLLIVFILIFILLSILLFNDKLSIIDTSIYNKLYFSNYLTIFFKIITEFGSALILVIISVFLILFLKNKKCSLFLILNLVFGFITNYLLKILFKRNRPIDINMIIEDGYSFPSGHTTVSAIFYGTIIYFIYKSNIKKSIKIILITLLVTLILLIGISRIYLGVHHPTDVIASCFLSIIFLIISINILYKNKLLDDNKR